MPLVQGPPTADEQDCKVTHGEMPTKEVAPPPNPVSGLCLVPRS